MRTDEYNEMLERKAKRLSLHKKCKECGEDADDCACWEEELEEDEED